MNLRALSDVELDSATQSVAGREQTATLELLHHLAEVRRRRLFATLGFSSLWEYTRGLGYSESGTTERIRAMELLASEAYVETRLQSGELSLTTAAQLQTYFRKVGGADRKSLIDAARGKSKRELEAMLLARTPEELRPALRPEKVRQVAPDAQEVRLVLDAELQELLARFREVQGEASVTGALKAALRFYLSKRDPLRQTSAGRSEGARPKPASEPKPTPAATTRHIPAATRRFVEARAQGQCEHVTPAGHRCTSRYRLQADHITPYALTQDHRPENLRMLCQTHNQAAAVAVFGSAKMARYLPG